MSPYDFRTGVISPVECLKEGWELIKGQYWLFFGVTLVGILIASFIPFGILIGPMFCGIYFCLFEKLNGRQAKFEDLFKGFSFFKASLIASLFLIVPMFVCLIVMYVPLIMMQVAMMNERNPNPEAFLAYFGVFSIIMLIVYVVFGIIHTLMIFSFPLIVERNLSGVEAFKLSARAVMKNLGGVVMFIVCEVVLGMIGYLIFCVGVYLTIPIMFAGTIVMYRKVFPPVQPGNYNVPPPPDAFHSAGRAV